MKVPEFARGPLAALQRIAERNAMKTDTLGKLQNYIAAMAPHQKERMGGMLLVEAAETIKRLEAEVAFLAEEIGKNAEASVKAADRIDKMDKAAAKMFIWMAAALAFGTILCVIGFFKK
jgi:hypothetical protein